MVLMFVSEMANVPSLETPHSLSIDTKIACYTVSRWDFSSERKL